MMRGATIAPSAPGGSGAAVTVAAVRRLLAGKFRSGGIESAELDAGILVGHALALDHAALVGAGARRLTPAETAAIAALAQRRLAREPVARIVGSKEFWSLRLTVNAVTFVPRPETETVVDAALAVVDAADARAQKLRIADLGTGSGALLLALLAELPNAFGVGTDLSEGALRTARANALRWRLNRADFVACDMAAALGGAFDLIVSNPPYIATDEIAELDPDVRDFDPRMALDGGSDGLDCYRTIAATAPALLKPGGSLIVEIGAGQSGAVAALFSAAGLALAPPRTDLNGIARALVATKARSTK